MANQKPLPLGFAILSALVMNDDFRPRVVARALDQALVPNANTRGKKRLEKCIRDIPGIMRNPKIQPFGNKPLDAGRARLEKLLIEHCQRSDALMGALLQLWLESQAELKGAVREYIQSKGLRLAPIEPESCQFSDRWTHAAMVAAASDFRQTALDSDVDDVALMLCCLTSRMSDKELSDESVPPAPPFETASQSEIHLPAIAPTPTAGAPVPTSASPALPTISLAAAMPGGDPFPPGSQHTAEPEALQPMPELLTQVLASLRDVPADAELWHHIEGWLVDVRGLAQDKLVQRDAGRLKLQAALQVMVHEFRDDLLDWDLPDAVDWIAEQWPHVVAAETADLIETWLPHLRRYGELLHNPPRKITEQVKYQQQMHAVLERIFDVYRCITSRRMLNPAPCDVAELASPPDSTPNNSAADALAAEPPAETRPPASVPVVAQTLELLPASTVVAELPTAGPDRAVDAPARETQLVGPSVILADGPAGVSPAAVADAAVSAFGAALQVQTAALEVETQTPAICWPTVHT